MRSTILAFSTLFIALAAQAHSFHSDEGGCTADHFSFDDRTAYVQPQVIETGAGSALTLKTSQSPVKVVGYDGAGYRVTACKAASSEAALAQIKVSLSPRGELTTDGPRGHDWAVTYLIEVPRGGDIHLHSENGPLMIRDVQGTVDVSTENGPLGLRNVTGTINASAVNGPINIKGGSGTMKARTENGPLVIHLDGAAWTGGTLDASTKNGPLSLKLPTSFGSGVVVETDGRGPISCKVEGCENVRPLALSDDRDEPRRIELGHGPATVHLSTANGPVMIKESDQE